MEELTLSTNGSELKALFDELEVVIKKINDFKVKVYTIENKTELENG